MGGGFIKHYSGYVTYPGEICPFIKENGCVLGEDRFLECKLYPLEISGFDQLVLKPECPYTNLFDNKVFFKKGYDLLEKYKKEALLNEQDIIGILNNEFWRVAEKEIV